MQYNSNDVIKQSLSNAMPYDAYRLLVSKLARKGLTSGAEHSPSRIQYTLLNEQRMKRWEKTLVIPETKKMQIEKLDRQMIWLVITESWCGDA
ncbi:MAG: thioredoxin family protein, partial [Flavobacteriaceae bacterium]